MGLFDKKKKGQNLEESTSENLKVEDTDVTNTIETGRRFFVVIDGVTSMLDGNGSIITGQLYGKVNKGDKVYIYQASAAPFECEIQAVEAKIEEKTSIVDEAEDTSVSLQLNAPDDAKFTKYAVLSNLKPQDKVDPRVSIENPALAGIINGMVKYGKDNGFHGTVAYWLSHGHFLTPIKMDSEPEVNEQGVAVIKKDTKIGFYMLKSQLKIKDDPDRENIVLPLFTDWDSLKKWEGLAKDGARIHTQILTFQDVYAMLKRGDVYAGIAINPFNKVPCTLPIPYLDTIVGTPGYQAEFGSKDASEAGKVQEEKIPEGKRILLGVPKETEEVIAMRAKLSEYGQAHDDIKSISFLTKIEEDTKVVRHLVVLEFPADYTTDQMKVHMEAIFQELNPMAHEIKQIEYAIKGRIPAIDSVVAQHADTMVVYTA